ncbi:hypothetical protein AGMMS49938_17490 [Fibrobacterales bacterium]|nr:hypothetical protein AGMMS49938_17490 [Fibrobacterales bacterium]
MTLKKSFFAVAVFAFFAVAYQVQKGDTLWDLSEEYLKDPFAWQDLWKANPHIQDPHWIYPGDSLCVPGEAPCPEFTGENNGEPTPQKNTLKGNADRVSAGSETEYNYKKPEPPKIFNSYYQRLVPILEPVSDKKNKDWYPVFNDEVNKPLHHSLEHSVLLGFGKNSFPKLKNGDLAEVWSIDKVLIPNAAGSSDEYFVHRLSAIAKVSAVGDSLSRATIVQSFHQLDLNKARSRLQPKVKTIDVKGFKKIKSAKVEDMAQVSIVLDKSIVVNLYSYLLLNKGKSDNYIPGTAVAFWDIDKRDKTLPPRLIGRGMIVHSEDSRSIVLVRDLYNSSRRVDVGTLVSVTHTPIK